MTALTYYQDRISQLGITPEQNTFLRTWTQESSEKNLDGTIKILEHLQEREYRHLDHDEEGNFIIRYFNLQGQPYRWKKEDTKQARDFVRIRLATPGVYKGHKLGADDQKYFQENGSPQNPFFPKGIIKKYQAAAYCIGESETEDKSKGQIPTLFLTEGEFKSIKGELCNIDIVGLPSIHGFYNGETKGKLHGDLEELIIKCRVQKIVFLVDADLLTLKWGDGKDLAKRPTSFYSAVKAFRESLEHLIDNENIALKWVYFMHLKTKFVDEDAKGLDDLLIKYSAKAVEIQEDIYSLQNANSFFYGMVINDINRDIQGKLFRYLGLTDEQEFYKTYSKFIGPREFKFKRKRYQYDQESKEVKFVRHEDADKFMRIGIDWVKVVTSNNKFGKPEEEIIRWNISEIKRDYEKYPDFVNQIQKYDKFCNEPCFNGDYKRAHANNYNIFNPISLQPTEGSIEKSVFFLKHIFNGSSTIILDNDGKLVSENLTIGDPFAVALDWLTIALQQPKHMLPVPILVSKENNTGKSTYLKWLQTLFGSNMTILGNEQFKAKFNAHYISKFLIAVDEGFLEVDKKSEKERLKQLVTADTVYVEFKGMDLKKINYYGKLLISSNDADRVMKIDEGESRWFVVKVPVITGDRDPDLELKLNLESPAWLHYLLNRNIFHPRKDRLWFKSEWFITDQFRVIVNETKSRIDRILEEWINEQFLTYDETNLEYTLKYLTEQMNDSRVSKYKIDSLDIKAYLKGRGMLPSDRVKHVAIPVGFKSDGNLVERHGARSHEIEYKSFSGRPYNFERVEWLENGKNEIVRKIVRKNLDDNLDGLNLESSNSAQNDDLPF